MLRTISFIKLDLVLRNIDRLTNQSKYRSELPSLKNYARTLVPTDFKVTRLECFYVIVILNSG